MSSASTTTQPLSEQVKFPKGAPPLEVQLKFATGRRTATGNFLYSLEDGRVIFAAPELDREIQAAGPRAGDWLAIQQLSKGWSVKRAGNPSASRSGIAAPADSQPVTAQQTGNHLANLTKDQILALLSPDQLKTMLGLVLTAPENGNGHSNGAGHPNGNGNGNGHAPNPTPPPPALMTGTGQFYLQHANLLIDVFAAAHKYSTETYNGTLSKEDIRALVTTVYIQHTAKPQGGR